MNLSFFYSILFTLSLISNALLLGDFPPTSESQVLICGVCRNISEAFQNTQLNIEELGKRFTDYAVIIYENNSDDTTPDLLTQWAEKNLRVTYLCENLPSDLLPISRTEKIARARNIVLNFARLPQYSHFQYLIMADLDFSNPWPIDEIVQTIEGPSNWDAVFAHGIHNERYYYDTYALRCKAYPLGRELLGDEEWQREVPTNPEFKTEDKDWMPVYSAFGGLGIYKTESILNFSYSGLATYDLNQYYQTIFKSLPLEHPHTQKYLSINEIEEIANASQIPIIFRTNMPQEHPFDYPFVTCCEHVTLHSSMANHGFGKFFINLNMRLSYY